MPCCVCATILCARKPMDAFIYTQKRRRRKKLCDDESASNVFNSSHQNSWCLLRLLSMKAHYFRVCPGNPIDGNAATWGLLPYFSVQWDLVRWPMPHPVCHYTTTLNDPFGTEWAGYSWAETWLVFEQFPFIQIILVMNECTFDYVLET